MSVARLPRPRGLMVSFGNAAGRCRRSTSALLAQKGSLYVTRPTLFTHIATREDLLACAGDLFAVVAEGAVVIDVNRRFPLDRAADAHRALEGRETTGSTLLVP